MRQQRALVLVLLGVVSILSVYIVLATQFAYGPVLLKIGGTHGVHVSDLPVLGLWCLAGLATWALWGVDHDRREGCRRGSCECGVGQVEEPGTGSNG